MADTFTISFPEAMDGKTRCDIIEQFQQFGWETYLTFDAQKCSYTRFEAFWPDDSKPLFPELPKNCQITRE